MRSNCVRIYHDDIGHVGSAKVYKIVTRIYWFPKMHEFMKKLVKNCLNCITHSAVSGKAESLLLNIAKEKKSHFMPFISTTINL